MTRSAPEAPDDEGRRSEVERALIRAFPVFSVGVVVAVIAGEVRHQRLLRGGSALDWAAVRSAAEERLHLRSALRGDLPGR